MSEDPPAPVVSVLVPCTRPERIAGIAAALAAEPVPCELVVGGRVHGLDPDTLGVPTVLIAAEPRLLSRNRRLMVAESRGDVLAFLDDDAVPRPGWLAVAASLPPDRPEIWTGPEVPTRSGPGARRLAEVSASLLAEGHRAHVTTVDRPVRWSEVPFCNLVVRRSVLDAVGLPADDVTWDLDDFDLCRRAASLGIGFRSRPDLGIAHDRYPDRLRDWLADKAAERRRTGEKLVRYPHLYLRIPAVAVAAASPWLLAGALVATRRRAATAAVLVGSYACAVGVASRPGSAGAWRRAAALVGLHVTTTVSLQVGLLRGALDVLRGRPDPLAPPGDARSACTEVTRSRDATAVAAPPTGTAC